MTVKIVKDKEPKMINLLKSMKSFNKSIKEQLI